MKASEFSTLPSGKKKKIMELAARAANRDQRKLTERYNQTKK